MLNTNNVVVVVVFALSAGRDRNGNCPPRLTTSNVFNIQVKDTISCEFIRTASGKKMGLT